VPRCSFSSLTPTFTLHFSIFFVTLFSSDIISGVYVCGCFK
jgi:hypothetical protein